MVAKRLLEKAGYDVVIAQNGKLALEAVQQNSFALVLMDCQMPVMDGLEATRAIRALPGPESSIPIIAMTANAMSGDRETCLAAGMNAYHSKPIKIDEVLETIDELTGAAVD